MVKERVHEERVHEILGKIGANSEDTAKTLDEIFKAGTLTFGQVNIGLRELKKAGVTERIEERGVGKYYLVKGIK